MAEDQSVEVPQGEAHADRRASLDVPFDSADPMFSSDEFRIFEMKIRRCPRARPHDWTLCPFAHPVSLIFTLYVLHSTYLFVILTFTPNALHFLRRERKQSAGILVNSPTLEQLAPSTGRRGNAHVAMLARSLTVFLNAISILLAIAHNFVLMVWVAVVGCASLLIKNPSSGVYLKE